METRGPRVQLVLFLAAIFVPCVVLIALGVRIVNQDRELRVRRQADQRSRAVNRVRGQLLPVLESVRADEVRTELEPGQGYRHPETVFVGWVEESGLALPWEAEHDRAARQCRDLIGQPGFEPAIRACAPAASGSAESLDQCYGRAVAAARHPAQTAFAQWLWAQALAGAGRSTQAAAMLQRLLKAGPALTDEDGIPLELHAAQELAATAAPSAQIAAAVQSELGVRPWLPPMSSYAVRNIALTLAATAKTAGESEAAAGLRRQAEAQERLIRQAQSLQEDFARLRPLLQAGGGQRWVAYGDDPWLVGAAGTGMGAAVLAVRAQSVFQRLSAPGAVRFTGPADPVGEPLGDAFPGLKLIVASDQPLSDPGAGLQRRLLYLALLLVIAATAFAAYLLWRDLKRDMRLAELRAGFVASVSHELKTPLTAIRMFAETLQMGRVADSQTQEEYLGTIVSECERLSRLVDGVLLFSKTEQGKRPFRFRPTDAAGAVAAAARTLEYPLSQQGFRLQMKLENGIPQIDADRDAIEQAVLNLLSNAMKFSGEARDIELDLACENGEAMVRVADHGIGIAPEEQARIFEKFYRVSAPETQRIPGTGLGLALVAQIAMAHGGRVTVESAPGKGSVFCLHLPIKTGAERIGRASHESDSGD
jgi:signal transduction histidine kinase